ncbi:hypothetical protein DP107_07425 [Haloglomus irregulare]|jgi:hypothetical protein|uniref:Uncharacterized protein n=1 Tax=Haloglomus irregulare TaxID=2234134 RepID=A0A554NCP4_9EURY|nr:hypothetical protein [Haloglomus irregulare]TSD14790.1 hypothetical protein DP107_07425 [Haloglomus irregulare]
MDTLELPTGETVTPEDVFCYEGYPYRFLPAEARDGTTARAEGPGPGPDEVSFYLVPLHWGGGDMDVPFPDRAALVEQWEDARGVLTDAEWEDWLAEARADDRFDDAELDAIAAELGLAEARAASGLLARVRRLLG